MQIAYFGKHKKNQISVSNKPGKVQIQKVRKSLTPNRIPQEQAAVKTFS
jgi:hypothetical protein